MALDKATLSSLVSGLAFAAEAHLLHSTTHPPKPPWAYLLYAGIGGGIYGFFRMGTRWEKGLALAIGGTCGVWVCLGEGCLWPAALAASLLTLGYSKGLRAGPFRKPLTITLAWLLGLYALTQSPSLSLLLSQAFLIFALTIPYDLATQDTDAIPTLPKVYGERLARGLYGLSLVGYVASGCFVPGFGATAGVTALSATFLLYWPASLRWPYLLLYDGVLLMQALLLHLFP